MADVGPVDARRSARRAARSAGHARLGAAGSPLRPAVRRHAAPGARPQLPRRLRARPRRARRAAAAARGSAAARRGARRRSDAGLVAPGRSRRRPSGCCSRSRSARRRERLYLSYPRLDVGGNARARPVVLRARRDAGDHRPRARPPRAGGRRGARKPARAWRGRRRADPDRAIDDLEHDLAVAEAAARLARSGVGQGPRALPARAERGAAPVGHQPLGARPHRPGRRATAWSGVTDGIAARARTRTGWRSGRIRCRRCSASRRCPYQFLLATIHRLEPWDEPRAARPHGSADARQPVPSRRRPSSTARSRRGTRCRSRAPTLPRRGRTPRRGARPRRRRVRRDTGAGDRARLARRNRRPAARSRHLGAEARRRGATGSPTFFEFSFGLNDEGRDPRSLPDPIAVDGRFVLRGSVDLIERHAAVRRPAGHRSQDRQEPIEPRPDRRRRRGAAAGALQHGDRAGARQEGRSRAACSTARPPAGSPSTRSRSTTTRAARASQVLTIVDRAVEQGFLPAAPAERACTLVRLPPGLRPARRGARRAQGRRPARRPCRRSRAMR